MAPRSQRTEFLQKTDAPPEVVPLDSLVGYALRGAQVLVFQEFSRCVGEDDIRPAQFSALALAALTPGLSQAELAGRLNIEPSRMVGVLDRLESRGLAVRRVSKHDRRSHGVYCTPKGRAFIAELSQKVRESDQRATARLTPEERNQLIMLLSKMRGEPAAVAT